MKRIVLCLLFLSLLLSCSSKRTPEETSQSWKEYEVFQELIQKPFRHLKNPSMMDTLTLSITEKNIKAIADAAEKLADSPLPDKMNNEAVRNNLQKIKTDSRSLADQIAEGTEDDVIGTVISNIYNTFLEVKKTWEAK